MKNLYNFQRFKIILLIVTSAALFFITGLWTIFSIQSKTIFEKKLLNSIKSAERLSTIDNSISFERALKIYSNNLTFSIFSSRCEPLHIKDLKITTSACVKRDSQYVWIETNNLFGTKIIIGSSNDSSTFKLLLDYKDVIFMISITYFLFILILTIYLFNVFLDKPLERVSNTVNDIIKNKNFKTDCFENDPQTLLSEFYRSVSLLIGQVETLTRDEARHILSKQIVHDLQAPLHVLENEAEHDKFLNPTIKFALKRLKDISSNLITNSSSLQKNPVVIETILNELQQMYQSISFKITSSVSSPALNLLISDTQLFRFLTNLIKNSIESGSTYIYINLKNDSDNLLIAVSDNGAGIDAELIPHILKGYTTKTNGNGLGISSINTTLRELNGDMKISNLKDGGLIISLTIPIDNLSHNNYVLIDDDRLIRASWLSSASKKNINLKCFENVDEFIGNLSSVKEGSLIYIDSQLRNGINGENEAIKIFEKGFTDIFLATGFYPDKFDLKLTPWIKKVVSKAIPF